MPYQPTQSGFPALYWPIDNACSNWPITGTNSTHIKHRILFSLTKTIPNPTKWPRWNSNCRNIDRQYFKRWSSNHCKLILRDLKWPHMTSNNLIWPHMTLDDQIILGGNRETEWIWKFKSVWTWRRMKIQKLFNLVQIACSHVIYFTEIFLESMKLTSNDLERPWPMVNR